MASGDRERTHDKSERAQFEALGRFVQSFESIVHACRQMLAQLIPDAPVSQQKLNLLLHHKALGANALFEMARGVAELHVDLANDRAQSDRLRSVFKQAASDFKEFANARNSLLHGTWHVGWRHPSDPPADSLQVMKFTPKNGALGPSSSIPASAEELRALASRCDTLTTTLQTILVCLILPGAPRLVQNFHKIDGRWCRISEK